MTHWKKKKDKSSLNEAIHFPSSEAPPQCTLPLSAASSGPLFCRTQCLYHGVGAGALHTSEKLKNNFSLSPLFLPGTLAFFTGSPKTHFLLPPCSCLLNSTATSASFHQPPSSATRELQLIHPVAFLPGSNKSSFVNETKGWKRESQFLQEHMAPNVRPLNFLSDNKDRLKLSDKLWLKPSNRNMTIRRVIVNNRILISGWRKVLLYINLGVLLWENPF